MRRALFNKNRGDYVECCLCPHNCRIRKDSRGLCQVRENRGGSLYTYSWGNLVAASPDPIEKKPFYHFLPGSKSFSIACPGCNFKCDFCQNWRISQADITQLAEKEQAPEKVISEAKATGSRSIAYTYTEPTIYLEYALEVMKQAEEAGIANVFVSNGYTSAQAREAVIPLLDAVNVDLKSARDEFYRRICAGKLEPVLESIRDYKQRGVWVEVTTLVIPDLNDSNKELEDVALFLAELDPDIPWHVSRFHPDYKRGGGTPTSVETIQKAVSIGREKGLKHIYPGNIRLQGGEDTHCPECKNLLIERHNFSVKQNNLRKGVCPRCETQIKGVW
ncbi:MAG: AmmeMemoRadiSam system radical SAM enzyme [Candidatus Altiarchaeales archaeon]|nr:AmmeMemoRadiSam system radical SAM enzyme [Candidatus Altiarchaeales archaeon]